MARFYPSGGGGAGVDQAKLTAELIHVLHGSTAITKDSSDEGGAGTMPNYLGATKDAYSMYIDGDYICMSPYWGCYDTKAKIRRPATELGNAITDRVRADVTFTSENGINIQGTMPNLDATAQEATASLDAAKSWLLMAIPKWGCYTIDSKLYVPYAKIRDLIGLTAVKIVGGNTILGISGTALNDATITNPAHVKKDTIVYGKNGVKYVGTMTVNSIVSFSKASSANHTVTLQWTNPSKGPYEGFIICGKTGSYPSSVSDSRLWTGTGNNYALGATNSATIGNLAANTTYYFRIWGYCTTSNETLYSDYLGVSAATTNVISKKGTATALSLAMTYAASATVGNYALFVGGTYYDSNNNRSYKNTVDAYNVNLTHSLPTTLSTAAYNCSGAKVGNYAVFAPITSVGSVGETNAYNTSLTRSTPTSLSAYRGSPATATVGNYAIFAGGSTTGSPYTSSTVDAYNTSMTRSNPTALTERRASLQGGSIGNYALFAGGYPNNSTNLKATVYTYNTSLTLSTATDLSVARHIIGSAKAGSYVLFAGGSTGGNNNVSSAVDAYNASLTRSTPTALSVARSRSVGTSLGTYAMFGSGYMSGEGGGHYSTVDAYNASLTRSLPTALSVGRADVLAATVGNYALFAGGDTNMSTTAGGSNVVDVYEL